MTTNHRQTVEKRSDKSPRRAQDAATPTSKKQAPLGFLSAYLKNWFPRLWRFFYGVKIPNSKRYEDYCETTRSTVLAKDQLGQAGERYMFEWLCNQPRAQVVACNTENYYCEIDIVFLDHMMPDKDGIETLHEMRDLTDNPNRTTTAVCLTANAISGAREKYISEGFDDYLTKPIDADKLEEMLIKFLPEEKVVLSGDKGEPQEEEKPLPDWLLQCEGIDTEQGVKNCGGTEEYLSVLERFHSAVSDKADEIENFISGNDIKNYTIKVHALKSSARIIGAMDLSEKARLLEEAGNENNIDYIKENTAELLSRYRSYINILSAVSEKSEDLPDIPGEMLTDAYGGLSEFAQIQDYELARMVVDSLKEYRLPETDEDRFERIESKLALMDWDGIREILKEVE